MILTKLGSSYYLESKQGNYFITGNVEVDPSYVLISGGIFLTTKVQISNYSYKCNLGGTVSKSIGNIELQYLDDIQTLLDEIMLFVARKFRMIPNE